MELLEFTLHEALNEMPDLENLNFDDFKGSHYDFLLLALGFETRAVGIPEQFDRINLSCDEVIMFNYATNVSDNTKNRNKIEQHLKKANRGFLNLDCDSHEFTEIFRKCLNDKINQKGRIKVIFDISVCSSKLLLTTLKILFDLNVELTIVYTEAELYYPIYEEYFKNPTHIKNRENLGLTQGVETVILSQEYVGDNIDNNPEFVIAFPTFKPDRTKSILIEIDEGIFSEMKDRITWIIGAPHMEEPDKANRISMLREINEISDTEDCPPSYEVSTLNYKETVEILDRIYKDKIGRYHVNISDLGSKMQSFGISIFCHIRPEVSVYFSIPKKYNPSKYSEGIKDYWKISVGGIPEFMKLINSVDSLTVYNKL
jgi:hypothetical protein